jgi:hypothetical protein
VPDRNQSAGWEALPEQSGKTPEGLEWRADVLCRRPGKAWSVGFEAQVQLQGEDAYRQRQERYTASGIRTLWLVAHEPAALQSYWRKPNQHLPAFKTSTWKDQQGRPGAHVHVDGLSLSVADFVAGALSRQLQWYENGRSGVVTLVLREDQCWHRTCRKRVLLTYKAETSGGAPIDLQAVQMLEGYGQAYAQAQTALPDLADGPWPFRRVFASRCPHCRREIRYQRQDWASQRATDAELALSDTYASLSLRVRVPLGITVPEQGGSPGLSPHAGWHWGSEARWTHWAPLGGIGQIAYYEPEPPPNRLHMKVG